MAALVVHADLVALLGVELGHRIGLALVGLSDLVEHPGVGDVDLVALASVIGVDQVGLLLIGEGDIIGLAGVELAHLVGCADIEFSRSLRLLEVWPD